jgi:hypothetical protein
MFGRSRPRLPLANRRPYCVARFRRSLTAVSQSIQLSIDSKIDPMAGS